MLISIYRARISVYYMGHSKSPADLYRAAPHRDRNGGQGQYGA
ncbi:hypothetical protein LAWASA_3090 [Lawsonibacter asaccharolyticus]|nr:hypothetical protein LAWASA_3090 [Lawsonibacter asaccharolyticus]